MPAHKISEFVPEIGRQLSGRLLDIWRGHDSTGAPIQMPADRREAYRRLLANSTAPPRTDSPATDRPAACRFRGADLTGPERQSNNLTHNRHWLHCLHPSQPIGPHVCPCKGCGPKCGGYSVEPAAASIIQLQAIPPVPVPSDSTRLASFDHSNLWPTFPGKRFNSSLIENGSGYAFAYRTGWKGSDIFVGQLDSNFSPVGEPVRLVLRHRDCDYGREDPRLFRHKGRLHIAFIGVASGGRKGRGIWHTNQMFARLSDSFGVEDIFSPADYPRGRKNSSKPRWEKNWQFFDYNNGLYAVYSIAPEHVVLKVESNTAYKIHDVPNPLRWVGGEIRGGASPVLVGHEWWCFVHDRVEINGHRVYRMGLYAFDAEPPFAPRRYVPNPILQADRMTRPSDQYCSCVFPCGAVLAGDKWVISMGVHDRWTELHQFGHSELSNSLISVDNKS